MSDRDAAYYQEHKDDEDEWEEAPPPVPRRPARRLDAIVSVRFSPAEQDLLRRAATQRGETLSTFIRVAALRAAFQPDPIVSVTGSPLSRVQVFGATQIQPSVGPLAHVSGPPAPATVTSSA